MASDRQPGPVAATRPRRVPSVTRWLRGSVSATGHGHGGRYVRLSMEREYGSMRAEVYLTRKQAKELLASLDWILNGADRG